LPIQEQLLCALRLSSSLREVFQVNDADSDCWRVLCENLCAEKLLWIPGAARERTLLARSHGSWLALFEDLWPLRHSFQLGGTAVASSESNANHAEKFRLATYCRFRPSRETRSNTAARLNSTSGSVTLPLHQRVALLQQAQPNLSKGEAVQRVLAAVRSQDGRDGVESVAAQSGFGASVLSVTSGTNGSVLTVSPGCGLRSFQFGHVFDSKATQEDIYSRCGVPLVMDLVNGVSGALVLYGQTGSGKTHSMFGPASPAEADRGLAPRISEAALSAVAERRASGLDVQMRLSYVEVFGNEIYDLLGDERSDNPTSTRQLLHGAFEVAIDSAGDLDAALALGETRKRRAETEMNERSTRAHTLLVFRLVQRLPDSVDEPPVSSRLFLADLGGSERVTKSRANEGAKCAGYAPWAEYYESRRRLTETNHINQGLLALKRCIHALNERQPSGGDQVGKALPVPFRDSRLTAVLEPALGGLARAAIVVCCSPEASHAEETVQSLRFGELCGRIEHIRATRSDHSTEVARVLKQIDDQVAEIERQIREKERWEWRERVRTDIVNTSTAATARLNSDEEMELGGLGAVEILPDSNSSTEHREVEHRVWGQVLVGAEAEREQLEALLDRRRQLLGEA